MRDEAYFQFVLDHKKQLLVSAVSPGTVSIPTWLRLVRVSVAVGTSMMSPASRQRVQELERRCSPALCVSAVSVTLGRVSATKY